MKPTSKAATVALVATCLSAGATVAAEKERIISFPADTDTAVTFKLLPSQGKSGRTAPISDNYRPQVKFTATKNPVMCAVRLPKDKQKIEPGESAEVALNYSETFSVLEKHKSFVAYEGGRKVAEGRIR